MRFSKKVIICVLAAVAVFTAVMVIVFCKMGSVPDALVTGVFAFAGGEVGALGLIKHAETKYPREESDLGEDDESGLC